MPTGSVGALRGDVHALPAGWTTYGRRLTELAAERGDRTAIIFAKESGSERHVSWRELDSSSTRVAHRLADLGVQQGATVVVALPNSVEHYFASYAAWKLGATVLPLRWDLPEWERERLLDIGQPAIVIGDWTVGGVPTLDSTEVAGIHGLPSTSLPDRVAFPVRAIASGGSTGRPKLIQTPAPAAGLIGRELSAIERLTGWRPGQTKLIAGALYHMSPFAQSYVSIFEGGTLVTQERFSAAQALDLIERHRVQCGLLVPTMLYRMARVPGVERRDFSSVVSFISGGAKLPGWVFRKWIDLLGGVRIWEAYGATEGHGNTLISGDDWLKRPGSVGLPVQTFLRICDDNGNEVAPGTMGEIYMKPANAMGPTFEYLGGHMAKLTSDGLVSVGDLGWVDDEGYLFVADRRVDMIISGAANIFPAEIEGALSEHPQVADVAVIGLPDEEWGRQVHAIVVPADPSSPPSFAELEAHCRGRLARYKIPKSYEIVQSLPRNDVGKLQRSALLAARTEAGG